MLTYVDHDPAAAAHAAAMCRAGAEDLRLAADLLDNGVGAHLAAWAGRARMDFDVVAADLAGDLRVEAARLEATADDIDDATRRARHVNASRREAHLAELRRQQEQCTPTSGPHR
jgi:hypothetical protein